MEHPMQNYKKIGIPTVKIRHNVADSGTLDASVNQFYSVGFRIRNTAGSSRILPRLLLDRLEICLGPALAQYRLPTLEFAHDDVSAVEHAIVIYVQPTECVKRRPDVLL